MNCPHCGKPANDYRQRKFIKSILGDEEPDVIYHACECGWDDFPWHHGILQAIADSSKKVRHQKPPEINDE